MIHTLFVCAAAVALSLPSLDTQFNKIAADARGRVGVAVALLGTGESADLHGDEHFPMHSVYKVPIAMAMLRRVDRGELKLDQLVSVVKGDSPARNVQPHPR